MAVIPQQCVVVCQCQVFLCVCMKKETTLLKQINIYIILICTELGEGEKRIAAVSN